MLPTSNKSTDSGGGTVLEGEPSQSTNSTDICCEGGPLPREKTGCHLGHADKEFAASGAGVNEVALQRGSGIREIDKRRGRSYSALTTNASKENLGAETYMKKVTSSQAFTGSTTGMRALMQRRSDTNLADLFLTEQHIRETLGSNANVVVNNHGLGDDPCGPGVGNNKSVHTNIIEASFAKATLLQVEVLDDVNMEVEDTLDTHVSARDSTAPPPSGGKASEVVTSDGDPDSRGIDGDPESRSICVTATHSDATYATGVKTSVRDLQEELKLKNIVENLLKDFLSEIEGV